MWPSISSAYAATPNRIRRLDHDTDTTSTEQALGKPMTMSGATVYYFDDRGRIIGHWQIVDRLGIYQQLHNARAPD
ncbi:MAG: ester cyclase [Hyphomicrobiaceae bacterium]